MIFHQRKILIERSIKKSFWGFLILFLFTASSPNLYGQEGWMLSTSIQYSGGNYLYNNSNRIFYIYGGAGYQAKDWSISISVPVVSQSSGGVGQVGGMMLPNGISDDPNNMMGSNSGTNSGGMMGNNGGMMGNGTYNSTQSGSMSSSNHFGLGDIYLYGSYNLLDEFTSSFDLNLNPFVKIPTANETKGLGTGEFDYGISATAKKTFDTFVTFADLGYIIIGKPESINYKNPLSYGLGFGKFFNDGNYSLLLYYQAYTTILEGYDSPELLSLGFNYKLNPVLTLSFIGSAGLSKVTSDYSFSSGLKWNL